MNKERNYNRRYPNEYNIFRTIFYMSFLYFVVVPFTVTYISVPTTPVCQFIPVAVIVSNSFKSNAPPS